MPVERGLKQGDHARLMTSEALTRVFVHSVTIYRGAMYKLLQKESAKSGLSRIDSIGFGQ